MIFATVFFYQDPEDNALRRWLSRPTNVGVVSLSFGIPFLTKVGWWKIKVVANGQEEVKKFKVEKWFTPRFEVSCTGGMTYIALKNRENGSYGTEYQVEVFSVTMM